MQKILKSRDKDDNLIFCIGYNKTGTTSLYHSIINLGFQGYSDNMMANAEFIMKDAMIEYSNIRNPSKVGSYDPLHNNFDAISEWVEKMKMYKTENVTGMLLKNVVVFKDIPFSLPVIWRKLYQKYPNAKFILSERDSEDQWYDSICKFHQKGLFSDMLKLDGQQTSWADVSKIHYRYESFLHDYLFFVNSYGFNKGKSVGLPYNKKSMIASYNLHNKEVKGFFNGKDNFIAVNVSNNNDYLKLCSFLNTKPVADKFLKLKVTKDM